MYSVKNVKSFVGREGNGFNASLYKGNKKVAFVRDEALGGEFIYEWVSEKEKEAFECYVRMLPEVYILDNLVEQDADFVVSDLVDTYETEKKLKKACKTHIVFRLSSDTPGEYKTIKKFPGIDMLSLKELECALEKQFEDKVKILNKKY